VTGQVLESFSLSLKDILQLIEGVLSVLLRTGCVLEVLLDLLNLVLQFLIKNLIIFFSLIVVFFLVIVFIFLL